MLGQSLYILKICKCMPVRHSRDYYDITLVLSPGLMFSVQPTCRWFDAFLEYYSSGTGRPETYKIYGCVGGGEIAVPEDTGSIYFQISGEGALRFVIPKRDGDAKKIVEGFLEKVLGLDFL